MSKNVGTMDGVIRVLIGMVLIFGAMEGAFAPWGWIGLVPLATAVTGICPLYSMIGMNTCEKKSS